jgi:hypothetical protein
VSRHWSDLGIGAVSCQCSPNMHPAHPCAGLWSPLRATWTSLAMGSSRHAPTVAMDSDKRHRGPGPKGRRAEESEPGRYRACRSGTLSAVRSASSATPCRACRESSRRRRTQCMSGCLRVLGARVMQTGFGVVDDLDRQRRPSTGLGSGCVEPDREAGEDGTLDGADDADRRVVRTHPWPSFMQTVGPNHLTTLILRTNTDMR